VLRWVIIGTSAAVLAIAGCCGLGMWRLGGVLQQAQEQAERARVEEEAKRRERTVVVPAEQLLKEFQDDPDAADRKYKGKYLELSGVVERVGRNRNEGRFAILHGGDKQAKLRVECFFQYAADEAEEARIEQLAEGQAVTVRGEYDGRVTNVQMRGCVPSK
jgi:hypothetical protein